MSDQPQVDTGVPSSARIYDYMIGGKDNFAVDREAAEQFLSRDLGMREAARNNRAFLNRAVDAVAAAGITQLIDVGTGMPTPPAPHESLRAVTPDARVVYVDNDPIVLAHDRALLGADPGIVVLDADVNDPDAILTAPEVVELIDFDRPVAVVLAAILHFVPGDGARRVVDRFTSVMAPGSFLVASVASSEGLDPEEVETIESAWTNTPGGRVTMRDRAQITSFFDGLELLDPGVADVSQWRALGRPTRTQALAGVARKP